MKKTTSSSKILLILIVFILSLNIGTTSAQVMVPTISSAGCVTLASNNLRFGSYDSTTSGEVTILQNYLNKKGYLKVNATGYYGNQTVSAVKAFQVANKLSPVGIAGPQTKAKIKSEPCSSASTGDVSPKSVATTVSTSTQTTTVSTPISSNYTLPLNATLINTNLELGSKGVEVASLQKFLQSKGFFGTSNGFIIGQYDAVTKAAVMAYQTSVGISPADGLLGPLTRASINSNISTSTTVTNVAPVTNTNTTISNAQSFFSGLPSSYRINNNLALGSRGAEVVTLQSFLEVKGFLTMPSGVAKGEYDTNTKNAMVNYQISKGISPADGMFGPVTRAVFASDLAVYLPPASSTPTIPTVPVVTTVTPTTPAEIPAYILRFILSASNDTFQRSRVSVIATLLPEGNASREVTLKAECPFGVTVETGFDVCNKVMTFSDYDNRPSTYIQHRDSFYFSNAAGSSQLVKFIGSGAGGKYTESASVWVPQTGFGARIYSTYAKIDSVNYEGNTYVVKDVQSLVASAGKPIQFMGGFGVTAGTGSIVSTTWVYGDGTSDVENHQSTTVYGDVSKNHTYTSPGTYTVYLVTKTTNVTVTSSPFTVTVN